MKDRFIVCEEFQAAQVAVLLLAMFKLQVLVAFGVTLLGVASSSKGATTVVVNGTASHSIPPLLCTYFIEFYHSTLLTLL